jgi:hypothetical protein
MSRRSSGPTSKVEDLQGRQYLGQGKLPSSDGESGAAIYDLHSNDAVDGHGELWMRFVPEAVEDKLEDSRRHC